MQQPRLSVSYSPHRVLSTVLCSIPTIASQRLHYSLQRVPTAFFSHAIEFISTTVHRTGSPMTAFDPSHCRLSEYIWFDGDPIIREGRRSPAVPPLGSGEPAEHRAPYKSQKAFWRRPDMRSPVAPILLSFDYWGANN